MLAALPILDITLEVARAHAELVAAMRQQGPPLARTMPTSPPPPSPAGARC
jgi:hypothetical protein